MWAIQTLFDLSIRGHKAGMAASRKDNVGNEGAAAGQSSPETRPVIVRGNKIDSGELFASGKELIITHGTEAYRLRLTSQNKLILTK